LTGSVVIDRWECKALKENREGWLLVYCKEENRQNPGYSVTT